MKFTGQTWNMTDGKIINHAFFLAAMTKCPRLVRFDVKVFVSISDGSLYVRLISRLTSPYCSARDSCLQWITRLSPATFTCNLHFGKDENEMFVDGREISTFLLHFFHESFSVLTTTSSSRRSWCTLSNWSGQIGQTDKQNFAAKWKCQAFFLSSLASFISLLDSFLLDDNFQFLKLSLPSPTRQLIISSVNCYGNITQARKP